MKHNAFGTRFSEAGILTWSHRFFTFSKVENGVSELWRIKAQIGLRGAKSPKRGASEPMKHNDSGTRFPEAGILTWSHGFFNFSKVKNCVSELWRTKAQIGLRGAKSTQLTTAVAVTTNHHSHAHDGHRRNAHSFHHGLSRSLHQRDLVAQARDVRLRLLTRPPC